MRVFRLKIFRIGREEETLTKGEGDYSLKGCPVLCDNVGKLCTPFSLADEDEISASCRNILLVCYAPIKRAREVAAKSHIGSRVHMDPRIPFRHGTSLFTKREVIYMRLSCRGRYATRALIELALHHGKKPLPLAIISKNQGISKKYLTQLMGPLKLAGLVRVVRGKTGGFVLAHHPAKITLGAILYAAEGDMSLIDCVKDPRVCYRSDECLSRATWLELSQLTKNYLDSTTLADILKKGFLSQIPDAVGK